MKYDFTNLGAVLNKYKVLYIPYYQREYVWGNKNDGRNLYKFIDDIFSSYKEHPEQDYLIGTLAFCSIQVNDIIDGQQRLTSLILVLSRLAENYCSDTVKEEHKKLLFPKQGEFIIQEQNYLTEEIQYALGLSDTYNTQGHSVKLSATVDRIDEWIESGWKISEDGRSYGTNWYDGLYRYILDRIKFATFEYNNLRDALKYYLNNNSLSIPLTNVEIFYSIFSQSIRIGNTGHNIFTIKDRIEEFAKKPGIKNKFNQYKAYDENAEIGISNIIYIFLKTYYQNNRHIGFLEDVGVGRWLSLYNNDIFNDLKAIEAKDFVEAFIQYIDDFKTLYNYFTNDTGNLNTDSLKNSSLYISYALLKYEGYSDLLKVLMEIFKSKHNYRTDNLYNSDGKTINLTKLNELSKRLNLTLLKQYDNKSGDRISGYITYIKTDDKGKYVKSIKDILDDINYDNYLGLNYKRDAKSNIKLNDDSRLIKVIFACQEAFLNVTADDTTSMGEYLENILSGKFSIEHLYSIKEWDEQKRLDNWRNKKHKFNDEADFDAERFKFLNLSLLNSNTNSTAGTKEIYDKLSDYKQAKSICNNQPEYLIQSLVDNSDYYNNANIQTLAKKEGLPERKINKIDQNTWEHSPNNRDFNIKLIKLAFKYIANI